MKHYTSTFQVETHENKCFISIRSTENRVDTFSFSKEEIEPLILHRDEDIWVGSEKISIKISSSQDRATLKMDKGHSYVSYSSSIRDMQMLIAQLEDIFYKIEYSNKDQKEGTTKETHDVASSSNLLQAINAIITRQNQMLLHEIDMRIARIKTSSDITPQESNDHLSKKTDIFIPTDIGRSLTGKIETTEESSSLNAAELAKQLKSFKDTTNE